MIGMWPWRLLRTRPSDLGRAPSYEEKRRSTTVADINRTLTSDARDADALLRRLRVVEHLAGTITAAARLRAKAAALQAHEGVAAKDAEAHIEKQIHDREASLQVLQQEVDEVSARRARARARLDGLENDHGFGSTASGHAHR